MERIVICEECKYIYDTHMYKNGCPSCTGIVEIEKLYICTVCGVSYQAKKCPVCQLLIDIKK